MSWLPHPAFSWHLSPSFRLSSYSCITVMTWYLVVVRRDAVICLHPSSWLMRIPQLGHPRTDGHLDRARTTVSSYPCSAVTGSSATPSSGNLREHLQSFAWAAHATPWSAHVIISVGTGRKLLVRCHLTPLCRVTSWTSPCFQLQPPPNHSTVWTGSLQIKQGPSEASQCSLRSGLHIFLFENSCCVRPCRC